MPHTDPASDSPLILGTRGSELALAQTAMVKAALLAARPSLPVDHQVIRTLGDQRQDIRLSQAGTTIGPDGKPLDKGIFTRELEVALREGRVHAAVHSLKDVPTELEPGFEIASVLPRAAVEDVIVFRSPEAGGEFGDGLERLPRGAVVATSSVRRKAQLLALRPDLEVVEIRGNVPTRLRKLRDDGRLDALMLARAGLDRLGLLREGREAGVADVPPELVLDGHAFGVTVLDARGFLPAASQAAVAIEVFRAPDWVRDAVESVNHAPTFARIRAERRFLFRLGAGCQTPVGILTDIVDGAALRIAAAVFEDDGRVKRCDVTGSIEDPEGAADSAVAGLE